jgi:hypothetical protein
MTDLGSSRTVTSIDVHVIYALTVHGCRLRDSTR